MQTAQCTQVKPFTETLQRSYLVQKDVSFPPVVSKMAEADPKFTGWDGNPTSLLTWIVRVSDIAQARDMSDAVSIRYARLALGDFARGHFPAGTTFVDLESFFTHLKNQYLPRHLEWQLIWGLTTLRMVGTDFNSYMAQFMSHLEQMKTTPGDFLLPFFLAGLHPFIRYEVTRENPATLTEAIAKARQVSLDAPPP